MKIDSKVLAEAMLKRLILWSYTTDIEIPVTRFMCFAQDCKCPAHRFVVFRVFVPTKKWTPRGGETRRIKVALCQKHYDRYQVTGRMPRRKDWDKLIFRSMP